jgi:hypothetical protein
MQGTEIGSNRCNGDEEQPDAEENYANLKKEMRRRSSPVFWIVDVKRRIPVACVSLLGRRPNIYSLKTISELPNMREYIDTSYRKYACKEK